MAAGDKTRGFARKEPGPSDVSPAREDNDKSDPPPHPGAGEDGNLPIKGNGSERSKGNGEVASRRRNPTGRTKVSKKKNNVFTVYLNCDLRTAVKLSDGSSQRDSRAEWRPLNGNTTNNGQE